MVEIREAHELCNIWVSRKCDLKAPLHGVWNEREDMMKRELSEISVVNTGKATFEDHEARSHSGVLNWSEEDEERSYEAYIKGQILASEVAKIEAVSQSLLKCCGDLNVTAPFDSAASLTLVVVVSSFCCCDVVVFAWFSLPFLWMI